MAQMCSECGKPVPPYSGKRRYVCSPECSYKRACRHPNRPQYVKQPCSECGGEVPDRNDKTPFLTCGEECARLRRNRLAREKKVLKGLAESANRLCLDCKASLVGTPGRMKRCPECARERHRKMSRDAKRAQREARLAGGAEAQKMEAKRRTNGYLKRTYGISLTEYEALVEAQGGLCAICQQDPIGRGRTNSLVVDHCHAGGNVRSLLCGNCNAAIGLMSDDPSIADRAADYLRHWSAAVS